MKLKRLLLTAILIFAGTVAGTDTVAAQSVSLKTNALYWATTTPNLAVEFGLGSRITLEIGGGYNPFGTKIGSAADAGAGSGSETAPATPKSMRHWMIQPELRWWFMQRFAGTFIGLHLHGGGFDAGGVSPLTSIKNNRYDGWLVGAGVGIGRHWLLGPRWGIEAQAGFGFAYMEYDKYDCPTCETLIADRFKNTYIGPTRLSISLVYYLR